jgi:uncharacterized membrane protein
MYSLTPHALRDAIANRHMLYGVAAATFLLCGCNRQPEPVSESTPAVTQDPTTPPTDEAASLDTESGLAIKRGIVTLGDATRRYRSCGATADAELHDQTEKLLDKVYADLGNKPMYIEAYGQRSGDTAKPSFVLEELLFATSQDAAAECSKPGNPYELLALGRDPSWSVEVSPASLILKQASAPTEITFTEYTTTDSEGTVTYRGGVDKHVLELTVTQRACHDSNANAYYGYGATAKVDKQTYSGCARVGN